MTRSGIASSAAGNSSGSDSADALRIERDSCLEPHAGSLAGTRGLNAARAHCTSEPAGCEAARAKYVQRPIDSTHITSMETQPTTPATTSRPCAPRATSSIIGNPGEIARLEALWLALPEKRRSAIYRKCIAAYGDSVVPQITEAIGRTMSELVPSDGATLDLFTGAAAGWTLGMHRAGYRTIAMCEIDEWRRSVLEERWGNEHRSVPLAVSRG